MATLKVGGKPVSGSTERVARRTPEHTDRMAASLDAMAHRLGKIEAEYWAAIVDAEQGDETGWKRAYKAALALSGLALQLTDAGRRPEGYDDMPVLASEATGAECAVMVWWIAQTHERDRRRT